MKNIKDLNFKFYRFLISAVFAILFLLHGLSYAQDNEYDVSNNIPVKDINYTYGDYKFQTRYDTSIYSSVLTVKYKNKTIVKDVEFGGWIDTINAFDFNGDGKKNIFIESYTGGAHCCVMVYLGIMDNGKFNIPDTLFLGNAWYNIEDIEKDGKLEINTSSDMFAYAFTNYSETRFPPRVYRINNNKFRDVTKNYPDIVKGYIDELKTDLKEFTKTGFECFGIDEDTFNTDAGSVKTTLAAITACYHSIGEAEKGYELIDKTYKCPDKGKFVKILKDEYKLK